MSAKTLARQMKQTENLIRYEGTEITMFRKVATSDGAGGKTVSETPVQADDVPVRRFVGGVTYHHLGFNQPTTIGEQRRFAKVLVGLHTDTFEEGDEFVFEGNWYRVGDIIVDVTYERKAECEWLREVG